MAQADIDSILRDIIERKHEELNLGAYYTKPFSKIRDFKGNAIGQIGEEFAKQILKSFTHIVDEGTIHNEYDIKVESGELIEVKTARKGRSNDTFQFNGINPNYNYTYLFCIGVCEDAVLGRIFKKTDMSYIHKERKHFIKQKDFSKQLVQMNPQNTVNYKLTLNIRDLYPMADVVGHMRTLINK